jgi:YVTN family beta-propeller protein
MSDLPSGAVTFLFTDIEGSTRLVRQLRDGYAAMLTDHQRLLRAAFGGHDGHEIDTQGDAFFYAFAGAHDALLAAVDGQRALLGHPWPEGSTVKVRMGVHTGRASPADGRYTGLAVHRAARVCAAGHGGQVLVSQATQSLVEDDEEHLAIRLDDLGEHRLKDIDRPVRLYQLNADGLPAEFPPPRQEAEPTEVAPPQAAPVWRRPPLLAAAAAVAAAAIVAALLSTGGGGTVVAANSVVEIDARTNKTVSSVQLDAGIGAIAVAPDAVWVANASEHALKRVDPDRHKLVKTIGLGIGPDAVAVGEDAVWAAEADFSKPSAGVATLTRIDPAANEPGPTKTIPRTEGPIPVRSGAEPVIAAGAGALWVGNWDEPLHRLDPGTLEIVAEVEGVNSRALVIGAGAAWVVETFDKTVTRVDPETNKASASISIGAREPSGLAFGAGSLWVTDLAEDTVWRVDAVQHSVSGTIPVGDGPTGVAATDQAVWVANRFGRSVSHIDPATDKVVATIDLDREPLAIAVRDDSVWVTVA